MLKYLFTTEHEDGSIVRQTKDDISRAYKGKTPAEIAEWHRENLPEIVAQMDRDRASGDLSKADYEKTITNPMRPCWYDVITHPSPVVKFTLTGNGHTYTLDVKRDFELTVDGVPIRFLTQRDLPLENPCLFYSTVNNVPMKVTATVGANGRDLEDTHYEPSGESFRTYQFGVIANKPDGTEVEKILEIE